jgi:hypothetical protein
MGMTDREYRAWERQQREKYRKGLQAPASTMTIEH